MPQLDQSDIVYQNSTEDNQFELSRIDLNKHCLSPRSDSVMKLHPPKIAGTSRNNILPMQTEQKDDKSRQERALDSRLIMAPTELAQRVTDQQTS